MTSTIEPSTPPDFSTLWEKVQPHTVFTPAAHPEFAVLWEKAQPFTMTSAERGYALWSAVNTTIENGLPGCFVECGVWRGGSSMLIALTLLSLGVRDRDIYLFDTFEGMTPPGEHDIDLTGTSAEELMQGSMGESVAELVRAAAGLDGVRAAMESTGYDMSRVHFIQGDVSKTLPVTQTLGIALLRLDTDFYDSTLAELHHLYPRLALGGVLIIDDYGHWAGSRRAVEDYFSNPANGYKRPMLWSIDYTGRGAVKAEGSVNVEIARYDYFPPGIDAPDLTGLFPYAQPQNPWNVPSPYLRPEVPHLWRTDSRNDMPYTIGNASVEEAVCLYALARQFEGKRGLEIGSHFGWTAAHLVAAGLHLDCVDPEFLREVRSKLVSESLDKVSGTGSYRLWGGYSPDILPEVRESKPEPWSFAFIDGRHDGSAPADDARGVLPFLAPDALVVFNDLAAPDVEAGLAVFRNAGFSTRLFNTMQILGVAWRGDVTIFDHVADRNIAPITLDHLRKYLPGGEEPEEEGGTVAAETGATERPSLWGRLRKMLSPSA